MPDITSTITTPDGRSYRITHPADATDEQVQAYAAAYLKQAEPEREYPTAQIQRPKPESFLQGAEEAAAKVGFNAARAGETIAETIGIADAVRNLTGDPRTVTQTEEAYTAGQQALPTQGSTAGRIVGGVAATLPTLALPGGVIAQGAAAGALSTDARDPVGVALSAGEGALLAKGGDLIGRGIAGTVAPRQSGAARTLLNEGVELTPGQMTGGAVKRAEDIAARVPLAGERVASAQERGVISLNRAQINRSLRPIGERLPRALEAGHDAITYAGDRLSAAYNDVLPRLSGKADSTFANRLRSIDRGAALPPGYGESLQNLKNEVAKAFRPVNVPTNSTLPVVLDDVARLPKDWVFDGRRLRDASERLGDISAAWRRSDDPYQRILGDVADQYRAQLHALARRQNPADAQRLRDIDAGYASLVRTERAAAGADDGIFSAAQLKNAVRSSDRSTRKRQSARGQALDQDLANAANIVMTNRAAMGGSKDTLSLLALGALGSRALGGDLTALGGVAGIAGATAAYTPGGINLARGVLGRQAGTASTALGDLIRAGGTTAPATLPVTLNQGSN